MEKKGCVLRGSVQKQAGRAQGWTLRGGSPGSIPHASRTPSALPAPSTVNPSWIKGFHSKASCKARKWTNSVTELENMNTEMCFCLCSCTFRSFSHFARPASALTGKTQTHSHCCRLYSNVFISEQESGRSSVGENPPCVCHLHEVLT